VRRRRILTLLALVAALALASTARAGDRHLPLLDSIAAEIAGHPTPVYCEDSLAEWVYIGAANASGFTRPGVSPWVYLSPRQCETLWALATHENVGTYYASSAILTLAHEATHQRGGIYANPSDPATEGLTDCAALPLVPTIATRWLGVAATLEETYIATVRRRVAKRPARWVLVAVARTRTVPNPWLTQLATDALRWHRSKPAAYQGSC
jgi:hypothetical protein